jgi:hypothetical protein
LHFASVVPAVCGSGRKGWSKGWADLRFKYRGIRSSG